MQSYINIKIHFKCIIGVLNFERKKKQKVCVKFKAKADDFLDYAKVSKKIKKYYKKKKFFTIEESLDFICAKLHTKFPQIYYIKIATFKPKIIKNAKVGVKLKKRY
ncbi:dihydroneopterin aldolase [Campylobacter aviculae]|uniref:Dihydroneopterin aldolase n=1 Tax=Campylobacter aviculae TaxID=2510190 RepID=A0A4U7BTM6_9BACT|nr:dihydroneopterin aldolase [Campylobacter aviculae]TKX32606.1 dihydroneopterin aldolase [Campylobacter aviculae]